MVHGWTYNSRSYRFILYSYPDCILFCGNYNASVGVNSSTYIITSVLEKKILKPIFSSILIRPIRNCILLICLFCLGKIKLGLYDAIGKELFSQGTFSSSAIFWYAFNRRWSLFRSHLSRRKSHCEAGCNFASIVCRLYPSCLNLYRGLDDTFVSNVFVIRKGTYRLLGTGLF